VGAAEFSIVLPALLAGLLISATHVPLGMQVLDRGIVFVDIAIAQIAGVGVVAADLFGFADAGAYAVQAAALGAALLGAGFLTWTDRRWPAIQEALIGTVFVLAASAQILLLAGNPHGGEYLKDLLVGQILWVTTDQLLMVSVLTAVVLGLWFGVGRERLGPMGFYAIFGLAVTASVQLVGVYLVFATLIVPALASRDARRGRLAFAYGTAALGYVGGLVASVLFDLPTGPVIVCAMAIVGVLVAWRLARRLRVASPS
jgi:zinc/manganese transport system permease protein